MYPQPQKPTTCCGRGCDINCVWRSYFEAQAAWKYMVEHEKNSCNPFNTKELKTGVRIPPGPP